MIGGSTKRDGEILSCPRGQDACVTDTFCRWWKGDEKQEGLFFATGYGLPSVDEKTSPH